MTLREFIEAGYVIKEHYPVIYESELMIDPAELNGNHAITLDMLHADNGQYLDDNTPARYDIYNNNNELLHENLTINDVMPTIAKIQ